MSYIDSFYRRTRTSSPAKPKLEEHLQTSVCVIGGGLTGVSTALGLRERGVNCVLLEAEKVGWGASGRNGGFVSPGFSQSALKLIDLLGEIRAQQLYRLSQQAFALIKTRIEGNEHNIIHSTRGSVTTSWFDDELSVQNYVNEMNRVFGEHYEYWPSEKVADNYLTRRYFDGFLKPDTLQVHSLNYNLHTAQLAETLGAHIFEQSRVTLVKKHQNHWQISTALGSITADHVVYACSGHIDSLHGKLSRATLPVATYILLTEPLGEKLKTAIKGPYAAGDNRFSANYYRVVGNKQLLWGGRVSMFHPSQKRLKRIMLNDLLSVYPQLKGITGDVAWGGTMGYARHKMPQIGQLKPGEWYCQGFGGHGMATTTMGGELIADAIAKNDEQYLLFSPFGLDYVGKPFGPVIAQLAYWSYQLQDAFNASRKNRKL